MIRLIQVERLELQPCPTLFSERFAPSVSHFGDENNNLCQLLTSDPSLCSIFDAERLLRRTLGPPTNAANEIGMEFESILQYPLKVKSWAYNLFKRLASKYRLCFTWSQGDAAEVATRIGLHAPRCVFAVIDHSHTVQHQVDPTSHQFRMRSNHGIPKP